VSAVNRRGGHSPSLASRCDLDDGRTVFVKAVSPDQNPDSPRMLRGARPATRPAGAPDAARVPAGAGRRDAAVAPLPARRPGAAV